MHAHSRPKVLLLIPHLGGGGAERVTALLGQKLPAEKYELHLGLITPALAGAEEFPPPVHLHALEARRVRAGAFRLLRLIRCLKPELILSGMAHLNLLILLLRPLFPRGTRVLVRQNSEVSATPAFGAPPWRARLLYGFLYRRADRVICQTQAMAEDLAREWGLEKERLVVLPNPVDVEEIRHSICQNSNPWNGSGPRLLAVGRLAPEKGFDLLLQAMVIVRGRFPEAILLIAGTGPEEEALKKMCRALGLEPAVRFAGFVAHPWPYFPAATLFVLPSRREGLPNALLEAAAGGLPIVALPASRGLAELLRGQPGIWLAPEISAEALSASLLAALEALLPGERFSHPFVETFRLDNALPAYEALLDEALKKNSKPRP